MQARKRMLAVKRGKEINRRSVLLKTRLPRVRYSYKRMAKQVEIELQIAKKKYASFGENWELYYFNNFLRLLPGSEGRHKVSRPEMKKLIVEIDAVIQKLGVSENMVINLQPNKIMEKRGWVSNEYGLLEKWQNKITDKASAQQARLVLPVYIELRRRGYSHRRLCS